MSILKGSKKAVLDLVDSNDFLTKINSLLSGTSAKISDWDNWMPKGYSHPKESELKDFLKYNFDEKLSKGISDWWVKYNGTTPNWDIISTCQINGEKGLLLVEAKAHCRELEEVGKPSPQAKSDNSKSELNHKTIEIAIEEANSAIDTQYPGIAIYRDKCYQLSNRIAHAWWLANHGIPVVLMYLGFLDVTDMENNYKILKSDDEWQECFRKHSKKVKADILINNTVDCGIASFKLIVRSL